MTPMDPGYDQLSRREREMMDVLFERGAATAAEIREAMEEPPGYSAVRATLRILEEKGVVSHRRDGRRYVFLPTASRKRVRKRVLGKVVKTFFDGSPEEVVAALLDLSRKDLAREDLDRISRLIDEAKGEGR